MLNLLSLLHDAGDKRADHSPVTWAYAWLVIVPARCCSIVRASPRPVAGLSAQNAGTGLLLALSETCGNQFTIKSLSLQGGVEKFYRL